MFFAREYRFPPEKHKTYQIETFEMEEIYNVC